MDQHSYTLCFPRSAFLFEWNSKKTLSQNEPSCFNEKFFINIFKTRKDVDINIFLARTANDCGPYNFSVSPSPLDLGFGIGDKA